MTNGESSRAESFTFVFPTFNMGVCSKASLAWGFVIPDDKLFALLQTFRKFKSGEGGEDSHSAAQDEGPRSRRWATSDEG